ncbi:hypothetical protein [Pseudomonas tolaasii]|uniref:hypothetical protein n=1 Tax=Pseudomonas tolaasii TaxID=29442 RepID=UPI00038006DE|nr:hypothetical protein [Pseudomonas tolaasii]
MKPDLFTFDRHLFDLLRHSKLQFTTRELRDAYAQILVPGTFSLSDLRRYVYEHIRKMVRVRWAVKDAEHRARDQVYHLLAFPDHLNLHLVEGGFEAIYDSVATDGQGLSTVTSSADPLEVIRNPQDHLEKLLKEIRLDFLSSVGEVEGYKQLFDEMPDLKSRMQKNYVEARDRSSRLLGHLRAVERTLETFASA